MGPKRLKTVDRETQGRLRINVKKSTRNGEMEKGAKTKSPQKGRREVRGESCRLGKNVSECAGVAWGGTARRAVWVLTPALTRLLNSDKSLNCPVLHL